MPFSRAVIQIWADEQSRPVDVVIEISETEELRRLLSFVPSVATAAKPDDYPSNWDGGVEITFHKEGGSAKVITNMRKYMVDGRSDYLVRDPEGFRKFLQDLQNRTSE